MADRDLRVLIVDDEELLRINLTDFLEDEGFYVKSASSGESALNFLRKEQFDIAIVDMRLPGMNGNTLIIEAHRIVPGLKFIIHTGSADYSLPEELKAIGVTKKNIFLKPVEDLDSLLDIIDYLMK